MNDTNVIDWFLLTWMQLTRTGTIPWASSFSLTTAPSDHRLPNVYRQSSCNGHTKGKIYTTLIQYWVMSTPVSIVQTIREWLGLTVSLALGLERYVSRYGVAGKHDCPTPRWGEWDSSWRHRAASSWHWGFLPLSRPTSTYMLFSNLRKHTRQMTEASEQIELELNNCSILCKANVIPRVS